MCGMVYFVQEVPRMNPVNLGLWNIIETFYKVPDSTINQPPLEGFEMVSSAFDLISHLH